jgi:peroxiredoxin
MALLSPGDVFPSLSIAQVGGGTITLPDDLAGTYGIVLVNRGSWCPYCTSQLKAFQRAQDRLSALGATLVSFSVDTEEEASGLVADAGLTFPVGYAADPHHVAERVGAFVNAEPPYLQSTGFILAPDGTVIISVYSSGAIGRLTPDDVIGMLTYLAGHA